jgi:methionyl-tRNA formyltransferase
MSTLTSPSSTALATSKFAYFGTPCVARDTLAYLIEHGFKPHIVVTNPDAPKGRGQVLTPSETKVLAEEHDIPVLTPGKLTDEFIEEIREHDCIYAVVVAYGKILPEELINAFPRGILNVHYSLLPKYRGASPVESALLNGETKTGVTIQKMVKEMDAGDILASEEIKILPEETARELRSRLIEAGAKLLVRELPRFLTGEVVPAPQDHGEATRAPKIQKEEGELDLDGDGQMNWRKYRAFAESPGTYFFKDGKRYKITRARFENEKFVVERAIPEGGREIDYKNHRN